MGGVAVSFTAVVTINCSKRSPTLGVINTVDSHTDDISHVTCDKKIQNSARSRVPDNGHLLGGPGLASCAWTTRGDWGGGTGDAKPRMAECLSSASSCHSGESITGPVTLPKFTDSPTYSTVKCAIKSLLNTHHTSNMTRLLWHIYVQKTAASFSSAVNCSMTKKLHVCRTREISRLA